MISFPGGIEQFKLNYAARSKYFNRAYVFKFNSIEDELKLYEEAKKFKGGKIYAIF